MSLTSILSDRNNQELRDKFKTEFLTPSFKLKAELKAPPLTTNYGIVGTAFDYLLRFYLQYHNKDTCIQRNSWVADDSFKKLSLHLKSTTGEVVTGFRGDKLFEKSDLLGIITDQYEQTKINYNNYVDNGQITDELIGNTIFLAKLDGFYRAGLIDENFDNYKYEDIKDIKSLISLLDDKNFQAKDKCYLNPTFGAGSSLVRGADADLIIDNTLIDIKVTKNLKLDRNYLDQILGYYILSLIGGVNSNPDDKPIENIGIYFARHGELLTIPLVQFGDRQKFEIFKEWFISYLSSPRGKLLDMALRKEKTQQEDQKTKSDAKKKTPNKKTSTESKKTKTVTKSKPAIAKKEDNSEKESK
ncbi:hypothetical protein [Microcoleus sp. bin38.metabat.b11b12b14.051]|uniref:hypothetical protein n=1 Tax=Microcoleus sp. bin38.metabat.b11b12b14.051 TaxID=2742709 RepID=UPI0025FD46E3|nr:hypothetical protein [Microcoleus sp. bin38.metabat.b11b12b14.051]